MSKFGSYRNLVEQKNIAISKEIADYNVSKGLLFRIQNTPCPANARCTQAVRYSYVNNNCACVTQPCPQCAQQQTEYVPTDTKIYSVMPDCPANAMCMPALYAAKGKVNPVLEIPSGQTSTNIGVIITKKLDNAAVGVLVAAWGIDGYLAYKFWGKSLIWKAGIVAFTAVNAYSTMKYLKKRKENTIAEKDTTTSDKQSIINEIVDNFSNSPNIDKTLTQAQKNEKKDEIAKKLSTLSLENLKVAKEYVAEFLEINFKAAPEVFMKKWGDLIIKFKDKYGMERMTKILEILNK